MNLEEVMKAGIKVGTKLYSISYWEYSGREWDTWTVKKMKPKNMTIWSWRWGSVSVAYADFPLLINGDLEATLFKTKAEAAKQKLRVNSEELKEKMQEYIFPLKREIRYLKKMARLRGAIR